MISHEVAHAVARHGGERLSQEILVAGLSVAFIAMIADRLIGAWAGAKKRELGIA